MIYLTRKEYFSASHRLFNEKFSEEKNAEIYGKCAYPYGHGHNYEVAVTIVGEPDPDTGMILDLKKLSDLINEEIIEKVDHKHLNIDVDFLKGIIPTTENLAMAFWKILEPKIKFGKLYSITISETSNNFAEYKGD
ncbi:MAG: 6-carboxytetrahydropterin synthase [Bacteroidetes bacterium]|nr:6-carboxytetrahydropterin synthase [Bacteroidota bacterium]MBU1423766.1 6-carboxytetrahydropterin synthase [Bacteroidota bacterium]